MARIIIATKIYELVIDGNVERTFKISSEGYAEIVKLTLADDKDEVAQNEAIEHFTNERKAAINLVIDAQEREANNG